MGRNGVLAAQFVSVPHGPQVHCEDALSAGKPEPATHPCHMIPMLSINRGKDEFLAPESRMHRLLRTPRSCPRPAHPRLLITWADEGPLVCALN